MKYILHFVDGRSVMYSTPIHDYAMMTYLQKEQTLKLDNVNSGFEECINLKHVMRIELIESQNPKGA